MSAPIYLYTGPEFGLRNEAVLAVKDAMRKKYGAVEDYVFYSVETGIEGALEVLATDSLFTAATCVIYRGAEVIKKKADIEQISAWLNSVKSKSDSGSSVLILVSDEISVDSKLEKLVPKENRGIFWEMFENRKIPWIKDFFRKNGYSVTDSACEELLDLVENNTEALRNECSRFFACFEKGTEITEKEVDAIVAHNRTESPFTLFDAMADNTKGAPERLENSLEILQKLLLSKSAPVAIIAGLTFCFRRLCTWHTLMAGGLGDEASLKSNGFTSSIARKQYQRAAQVWTPGQAAAITALLASTDMELRSGGRSLSDTVLEMLVYSIIIKKGAKIQDYSESV